MQVARAFVLLCCVLYAAAETKVQKCKDGKSLEDYKLTVNVGKCRNPPCKFRKGRLIVGEYRFTTDRPIKSVTNSVFAEISGIPFPFIGVDGTSACENIYESDGVTKASCPLAAGKEYVYKHPIKILDIFPLIRLGVHWGLKGDDGQYVMCFELPAVITN